jgi:hypothetical protein
MVPEGFGHHPRRTVGADDLVVSRPQSVGGHAVSTTIPPGTKRGYVDRPQAGRFARNAHRAIATEIPSLRIVFRVALMDVSFRPPLQQSTDQA